MLDRRGNAGSLVPNPTNFPRPPGFHQPYEPTYRNVQTWRSTFEGTYNRQDNFDITRTIPAASVYGAGAQTSNPLQVNFQPSNPLHGQSDILAKQPLKRSIGQPRVEPRLPAAEMQQFADTTEQYQKRKRSPESSPVNPVTSRAPGVIATKTAEQSRTPLENAVALPEWLTSKPLMENAASTSDSQLRLFELFAKFVKTSGLATTEVACSIIYTQFMKLIDN